MSFGNWKVKRGRHIGQDKVEEWYSKPFRRHQMMGKTTAKANHGTPRRNTYLWSRRRVKSTSVTASSGRHSCAVRGRRAPPGRHTGGGRDGARWGCCWWVVGWRGRLNCCPRPLLAPSWRARTWSEPTPRSVGSEPSAWYVSSPCTWRDVGRRGSGKDKGAWIICYRQLVTEHLTG